MRTLLLVMCCFLSVSCQEAIGVVEMNHDEEVKKMSDPKLATATFGGGCFWCVEAIFQQVKGVHSVISGYSGGVKENPTYEEICSKKTKHAEVCQIKYDPKEVSFTELLEIFWKTHDPTTLNKQGNDVGPQYRSIILYHNEEQKEIAEKYKQKLDDAEIWSDPIVTEIKPFTKFYDAEKYHQNYYSLNPNQGYCAWVIRPKVEKFRKVFKDKLSEKAK